MLHLLGKNVFEVNLLHILAETFLNFLDYKYMLFLLFHNSTDNERSDSCIYFFYEVFNKQYQNTLVFTISLFLMLFSYNRIFFL